MTIRAILVVALLATSAAADPKPAPAKPKPVAPAAIEAAIKQSKAQHKALIAEFYTEWCKPCHIFEDTTLVDKRVKAALGNIMFVRYDAEAEPGSAAAARYGVSSFPTFLAIDKEGVARRTYSGIQTDEAGVKQFLSIITESEDVTLDEADVRAKATAKPNDPAVRLAAGRWYAERGRTSDALVHLDAVAANTAATAADRARASATADRLRRVAQWKKQLVTEKLEQARRSPATASAKDLAIATVDSDVPLADARDVFAKVFAAHTDPTVVNGLLYVALAAGAKAEALAAAQAALASSKEAGVLDTLAECYYVNGDRVNAVRVEDQALAMGKNVSLSANRARFDKGSGDSNEVTQLHADAARLWKRVEHVEDKPIAETETPSARPMAEMMALFTATRTLGETVAKACAADAGDSAAAYAHVTLDAAGKVTASVLYLEPTAPAALAACLTKNLATAKLPVVPGLTTVPPINIDFKPSH